MRRMATFASALFGSVQRTRVLVMVGTLGETYGRQLADVLDAPLGSVQQIVRSLEEQGVLVGRTEGRLRRLTLNPRFPARAELQALLERLSTLDPFYLEAAAKVRRRPRASDKPL
jgi:DNA-binding MarR family transcriptional regulator